MDMTANVQADDRLDLAETTSRYRRHIPVILLSTVAGTVLFGALTYIIPARYTATAEMTFAPQTPPDVHPGSLQAQALSDAARDSRIDGAVAAIQGLPVANRVVDALNLKHDLILVEKAQKYNTLGNMRDAIATALLDDLRVRRVGESPLIDVSYTSRDPLRSARIAETFGKAFEDQQAADILALSKNTSGKIGQSTDQLAQAARDADLAVARFKLSHGVVFDPKSPNIGQDISLITASLSDANAALAEAQSRARFVQSGGINDQLSANSALYPLQGQQAEVARKKADLEARYGQRHPKVIEASRELSEIDGLVNQERSRQAAVASASVHFAEQRVRSISASLANTRALQIKQIADATQLEGLQRVAETASQLYNNMLTNASQEAAKQTIQIPDATVTAHASPPLQPSFPILPLDLAVGFVLGLSVGVGIAYVRERWAMAIQSNQDIERQLQQTYFNSLPTLASAIDKPSTKDPVRAVTAHPLSLYTEAYRSLATSLRMSATAVKVIAVTSALPKEGKTTTSVAMALTMAMAGERVLLIDCDLRRRNVSVLLAPGASAGLVEVARGEVALEDVITVDESGLHVLPAGPQSHMGAPPFGSDGFAQLMARVRQEYDIVVIDTAPVLAVVDVRLLLAHVDALGLLARWRSTPIRALRAAIHQIEGAGGEIAGVALTLVDANAQAHAGYGDASGYYSEMKEYYDAA